MAKQEKTASRLIVYAEAENGEPPFFEERQGPFSEDDVKKLRAFFIEIVVYWIDPICGCMEVKEKLSGYLPSLEKRDPQLDKEKDWHTSEWGWRGPRQKTEEEKAYKHRAVAPGAYDPMRVRKGKVQF